MTALMPRDSRIALITGAGSGIGQAVAVRLASQSDIVGVFDVSPEGVYRTVAAVRAIGGVAVPLIGNVTSSSDLDAAVGALHAQHGVVTTVVASAGVEMPGAVLDISETNWLHSMSVNATGTFLTAKATLPDLMRTQGSFLAVASDAGVLGFRDGAAYVAAKHAVVGLVRAMALDYGAHGVRTNAVCPGPTRTPMLERLSEGSAQVMARYAQSVPLGRIADPSTIADVIAHLSSDGARHTNGLVYVVDGGAHAGQACPTGAEAVA